MSIASEITRLQGVKTNILNAIAAKGVSVPSGAKLADCPELISLIGGGEWTVTIGGRNYKTVTIGGITWLAENLDYKFSGVDIAPSGSPSTPAAWYYNNDEATYGIDGSRKCGLLYNWNAVKLLNDNKSELIPGWHVPTNDEWTALANAVGGTDVAGTRLKALDGAADGSWPTGWNGTDEFGFAAFPAGYRFSGSFNDLGSRAHFWTATENSSSDAYYRYFDTGASMRSVSHNKTINAFSVRLVKDSA